MSKKIATTFLSILAVIALPLMAFAEGDAKIDTGDTAFILISAALVLLMTPALAFFYGGMVRKKNVLNTMMNSFVMIGLISVQWVLVGYSLAFGNDTFKGLLGNFDKIGFCGVLTSISGTIPEGVFAMFQLMFAIITVALITGAFAERIKFSVLIVFALLWSTLIYDPLCHWVWGPGGWLLGLPALDFAGGTVVHISSGVSGLVAALVIGRRKGYGKTTMIPHNIPFVLLGAGLLWFGWFGFNAGSALGANQTAALAFITTNTAAAAALISWIIIEYIHRGKPTVLGAATGAVVGLVAITPAAGFVTPLSAIVIGLIVSPLCYFFITVVKAKLGYDDSLDAFGCHGIGGTWGAIATGLFATKSVNSFGQNGLFYGNPGQLLNQFIGIAATVIFSAVGTFVILKVISLFTSLKVSNSEEEEGLDTAQHGEDAYPDFSSSESIVI